MITKIDLNDIHDKNINFLIGSGASFGLFPTLALALKSTDGKKQTIETLAQHFAANNNNHFSSLLFMHYYNECIKPVLDFNVSAIEASGDTTKINVVKNYRIFIDTILTILNRKNNTKKRCNLFTTNYDGCLPLISDHLLQEGASDFVINDGSRGFLKNYVHSKNFSTYVCQTGIFDRHKLEIPQINLINLHGSVYWKKFGENIVVDYSISSTTGLIDPTCVLATMNFTTQLNDENQKVEALSGDPLVPEKEAEFWKGYSQLAIVNPTKRKFNETVFEEHYYQMLRLMSYELEKPQSVMITFGFSFADEHILGLFKRSVSNPDLQIYICCFNDAEYETMLGYFGLFKNVEYIRIDGLLDFTAFNNSVFNLQPAISSPISSVGGST